MATIPLPRRLKFALALSQLRRVASDESAFDEEREAATLAIKVLLGETAAVESGTAGGRS
jgi:hypothetical protein